MRHLVASPMAIRHFSNKLLGLQKKTRKWLNSKADELTMTNHYH